MLSVMRKIASIKQPKDEAKRVMLFDSGEGVYLFLYNSEQDGASTGDYWFETIEQAEQSCVDDYGITPSDWQTIPDPLPGCQHDWMRPTRVRRDSGGDPLYGQFEPYYNEPSNA
jgi:biofilm protein TabA